MALTNNKASKPASSSVNPSKAASSEQVPRNKSSKKKALAIVGASILAFLLVSGLVAALVIRSINNKPEKIFSDAIGKYFDPSGADQPQRVKATFKVSNLPDSASSGISEVTVNLDVSTDAGAKNAQVDIEVNASIFRVRGSLQSSSDGSYYLQVKDIPALLSSSMASQAGIPEETKAKLRSLDSKWIKISPEDIKELGGGDSYDKTKKCQDAVLQMGRSVEFNKTLKELYSSNDFISFNGSTEEVIDGRKMIKVDTGVDMAKLKAFGNGTFSSEPFKKLLSDCGTNYDDFKGSLKSDSSEDSEFRGGKFYVWVDKKSREISKLSVSGDMYTDGSKEGSIDAQIDLTGEAQTITTPTDTVGLVELLKDLGIQPESLQGGSDSGEIYNIEEDFEGSVNSL